jgi:hypothetical protein
MQKQIFEQFISNHSDNELALIACERLKEVFQKCSKNNTNEYAFSYCFKVFR